MAVIQAQFKKTRDTRQAVLSAAAKNFRERGYAAVSLREIAKTAGLTTGSLYYHFQSKEDVVREVLDQSHIHVRLSVEAALSELSADADGRDLIRCAMKTHMVCLLGDDSLTAANTRIFSQVPSHVRAATIPSRHEYEALWCKLLQDAKDCGFLKPDLEIAFIMPLMFGALNWTLEWSDTDDASVDAIVDQVLIMMED